MKRILTVLALLGWAMLACAQQQLPNISYTAILSTTCASATGACSGSVVAGQGGVPALPQANSGVLGSGASLDVPVGNYNAATITFSGTYTGATENFEFSDSTGGVLYFSQVCSRTDINLLGGNDTLPTNGQRAWQCPVWGSYRFRVRQSALSTGSVQVTITLTQAAIDPSLVVAASQTNIAGSNDPCTDASAIKSTVAINISSATTTQLVALSGTTIVYVCGGVAVGGAGTNPSFELEYGTGSTCGTGTTVLTGAMATGVTVSTTAPGPIIPIPAGPKTAAGNALCAVTGGTSPNFQGYITFVQQ